jgi:hypothetical protein
MNTTKEQIIKNISLVKKTNKVVFNKRFTTIFNQFILFTLFFGMMEYFIFIKNMEEIYILLNNYMFDISIWISVFIGNWVLISLLVEEKEKNEFVFNGDVEPFVYNNGKRNSAGYLFLRVHTPYVIFTMFLKFSLLIIFPMISGMNYMLISLFVFSLMFDYVYLKEYEKHLVNKSAIFSYSIVDFGEDDWKFDSAKHFENNNKGKSLVNNNQFSLKDKVSEYI